MHILIVTVIVIDLLHWLMDLNSWTKEMLCAACRLTVHVNVSVIVYVSIAHCH